ncbi:NXPE family member 3-like isoform X2 [Anneissia japonica]|nr:NXPE family member 3-like isoform X2 [Anneissia japonica]
MTLRYNKEGVLTRKHSLVTELRTLINNSTAKLNAKSLSSSAATNFLDLQSRTLTSAKHTRIQLLTPRDKLLTGKYISFLVKAFDSRNQPRNRGGDFWFAILHDRQQHFSTSGRITDFKNGTYLLQFYLGSAGDMVLNLNLVYTAEALDWIREIYRPDENSFLWLGTYRRGRGKFAESKCKVHRGGPIPSKCEYGRGPKGMGDTVFICDKPSMLTCDELTYMESYENMNAIIKPVDRLLSEYKFTAYFQRPFYQNNVPVFIKLNVRRSIPGKKTTKLSIRPCRPGFRPKPPSNGYWKNRKWKSLECKTKTWSSSDLYRALAGHEVHIIGDSTVKQWYESINNRLGRTGLRKRKGMYFNESYTNFVIHFHNNRLPVCLGSKIPLQPEMKVFEPELIDGLPSDSECRYFIILGHWAHYGAWTEASYRDHMFYIKEAIVRLLNRCNDVKVAIRSSHPRDHKIFQTRVQSNHWVFWDMNRILREVYADVPVHFIDVWDLAMSFPSPHDVHMPMPCVNEMVDLLMSNVFPTL